MIAVTAVAFLLLAAQSPQAAKERPKPPETPAPKTETAEANASTLNRKLLTVTRIFVDDFGSDPTAKEIQAMVINRLSESKRFIITENKDKADAVLKGTALEKTSQEFHSLSDKAAAASSHGLAAADDSSASTETINDARVAVRLVAADGDVIWTSTQESRGAKYKGASADVADKVVKQLLRDLDRLQQSAAAAKKSD